MTNTKRFQPLAISKELRTAAAALAIIFSLMLVPAPFAQAQTYSVIHDFTGGLDGAEPAAGLTLDKAGNLYGTAAGDLGATGSVFRLKRAGSSWVFSPLFTFGAGQAASAARVVFGPDGTLFGSTTFGGGGNGGVVFNLKPTPSICKAVLCPWRYTVLYPFKGSSDGDRPSGDLTFDQAGNIYGTTAFGGDNEFDGLVYQLTRSGSGWTENVLYTFTGGADGSEPNSGVIFDSAGNLYGTAFVAGADGAGTVFQLTPSGSGWTENTIYTFQNSSDGAFPSAGLIMDPSGNLIGATTSGGSGGGGTVFMLSPSNGSWNFSVLHSFTGQSNGGPLSTLTMDASGNIYGAANTDGSHGFGSVFKLTPSGDGWTYTSLYDFTGQSDGSNPQGGVALDSSGNIFGTTAFGGTQRAGVVFEITP